MPKYNFQHPEYPFENESEYESSDEESELSTTYRPVGCYPSGGYAQARRFASPDQTKERVVLSPVSAGDFDTDEVSAKYCFFKALYPDRKINLLFGEDTYRLILPVIPGVPYTELTLTDESQIIAIILSAVRALQSAHKKDYVIVDLKADNVHYDSETGQSFLIDGGLSRLKGKELDPEIFHCENEAEIEANRVESYHIAPECWSGSPVVAQAKMDVFSLGKMMLRKLKDVDSSVKPFLEQCLHENPRERPSLNDLELQLTLLSRPAATPRYGMGRFCLSFLMICSTRAHDSRAAEIEVEVEVEAPGTNF